MSDSPRRGISEDIELVNKGEVECKIVRSADESLKGVSEKVRVLELYP